MIVEKGDKHVIRWAIALLFISAIVRLTDLHQKDLWFDELEAVTYAHLPLTQLWISLRQFQPHPPLYFVQLHYWMLLDYGDLWLKLNSVLWSLVSVLSLFYVTLRRSGMRKAVLTALLFSIAPISVLYGQQVRMYSMLMALGVWVYFFTQQYLYESATLGAALGLVLSSTAFLFSHGAGFLILISTSTYTFLYLMKDLRAHWQVFVSWSMLQVPVLVLYLPWLYTTRLEPIVHTQVPDLIDIADTLFKIVYGFVEINSALFIIGILIAFIIGCIVAWWLNREFGEVILSFLVVPVIATIIISHFIQPIWLPRTLAYLAPFVCMIIANMFATYDYPEYRKGLKQVIFNGLFLTRS